MIHSESAGWVSPWYTRLPLPSLLPPKTPRTAWFPRPLTVQITFHERISVCNCLPVWSLEQSFITGHSAISKGELRGSRPPGSLWTSFCKLMRSPIHLCPPSPNRTHTFSSGSLAMGGEVDPSFQEVALMGFPLCQELSGLAVLQVLLASQAQAILGHSSEATSHISSFLVSSRNTHVPTCAEEANSPRHHPLLLHFPFRVAESRTRAPRPPRRPKARRPTGLVLAVGVQTSSLSFLCL